MRLTYWLSDKDWDEDDELHRYAKSLGYALSGYERPAFYLNHKTGAINPDGLHERYRKLNAKCYGWIPLLVDLEHRQWITKGNGPITPDQWFQRRKITALELREKFPLRRVGNWNMPQIGDPRLERLGCAWTYGCKSIYMRDGESIDKWRARRIQQFEVALQWQMPMVVYVSPAIWGKGETRKEQKANTRKPKGFEYAAMVDLLNELNPEQVLYWGTKPNAQFDTDSHMGWMRLLKEHLDDGGAG